MKRWMSHGVPGALGVVGCVIWTGDGKCRASTVVGATGLRCVRTADSPGIVRLAWTPSPERSVLGYTVHRRHSGESTFTLASRQLIRETSYTDRLPNPNDPRTMVYQVIAVAADGNLGTPAEVAASISLPAPTVF
jgi:hypothetical protein